MYPAYGSTGAYEGSGAKQSFTMDTLNDNWYEDKVQRPEDVPYSERQKVVREKDPDCSVLTGYTTAIHEFPVNLVPRLARSTMPDSSRVIPVDIAGDVPYKRASGDKLEFTTTKQAMDQGMLSTAKPVDVRKPVMVTTHNLSATLNANRETGAPPTGFAATLPKHPDSELKSQLETTNQHFYDKKPELDKTTKDPAYFAPLDRTHHLDNIVYKDSYETVKHDNDINGRAGNRGELTRRPGESGNPYGVSTWVDEYAKWGDKIKGMSLSETRQKMQTKYF